MKSNVNPSISCSVEQCKHHAKDQNNCCLSCISIGTHETNPSMDQCTDCLSFEK